jgi:hypothetical protein
MFHQGIWVTQLKNTGKIIDAFKTCENVMLVFSVNQSKAFQGYVRGCKPTFTDGSRAV